MNTARYTFVEGDRAPSTQRLAADYDRACLELRSAGCLVRIRTMLRTRRPLPLTKETSDDPR